MAKPAAIRSFDEVLSILGREQFDVSPAGDGASQASGVVRTGAANRVSKYGCAAEIAESPDKTATVRLIAKPGWLLGGEIARLTDRGYQKFLKTTRLEIPATAEILRAIHQFSEELKQATGALSLYNEGLGTTSDRYIYDRVKGRA